MGLAEGGKGAVLGVLFPFDCRTALKSNLFIVSGLQARTGLEQSVGCNSFSPSNPCGGCAVGRGCGAGARGRAAVGMLSCMHGLKAGLGESNQGVGC